jgi:predicted ATPase/DNA-binding SARP family transcriptional activator
VTTAPAPGQGAVTSSLPQEPPISAERSGLAVCVDVLGALTLRVDGQKVEVPGVRRQALLALLALEAGRVISTGRLVDLLWPDELPQNAAQALYNHMSRLRGHLGAHAGRLERRGSGYRLHLEPDELDADAARRLAHAATAPGTPPATAAELARAALELWRGRPLEELRFLPALEVESVGMDELRLQLVDDLVAARLALGDRAVTVDAAAAAAAAPLRERTALLHIEALARDGRTAEAMAAAQAYRRRLVDETGLDPGPALAELEQSVASGLVASAPVFAGSAAGASRSVARPDGPLVGREHDREEVLRLLGTHATVTITGPGGVGKSRLAVDVAAEPGTAQDSPANVVVVDLAATDRPERVSQAVASTLGLRTVGEVEPSDIAAALAGSDLLLVLDNCEHLPAACRELVTAVRRGAPGVRVLVTSRVTLHVPGEYVVRLQPLPVPRDAADLETLRRQPGVRAFVEHARRRRGDFELTAEEAPDLVEVIRRLDGLPLGIELAARQVALMPLRAVRERLDRTLDLATGRGGADADRQRTLRATIDSSYRLLGEDERRLLRSMATFPGGVDLDTLEVLARDLEDPGDPLDLLHRLVDASLVVADAARGRYRLLFTVRAFLLDEVERRGEVVEMENRFLERCLAIAEDLAVHMYGPDEADTDRRLRAELDNLRAARDSARSRGREDVRIGITLAVNDVAVWRDLREVWAWALELAVDDTTAEHPQRVAVLSCAADAARFTGDLDRARRLADDALALAGPHPVPREVHRAWSALGAVAHFRGDFVAAREAWLQAADGWPAESGALLASAALAAAYGADPATARELLDRAHAAVRQSGCGSQAAFAAYVEGELRATGRVEESIPYYVEAIEGARRVGANFVDGVAGVALASARTRVGDVAGAAEGFAYLIDYWRRTGQSTQLWTTVRNAAGLLASAGRSSTAALLLICADAAPGAAAVGPAIARHSGRAFTSVAEIVDPAALAELRATAVRLGAGAVLDRAVAELRAVVGE